MKYLLKDKLKLIGLVAVIALGLSSCYESNYYHRYHHHTHGWYDSRHEAPPAGVDFNVDVR